MIILKSSSEIRSQSIDTLCAPTAKLKKIYADAKLYRLTDSLLKISERQVAELKTNISLLEEKDVDTRNNYERQLDNLNQQVVLYKDQIAGYEKLIKREKRKRFLTGLAGAAGTAAAIYIAVTK